MLDLRQKIVKDKKDFTRFNANDWNDIKDRIQWKVINKKLVPVEEQNANGKIAHKDMMDLALVLTITELSKDRRTVNTYSLKEKDLSDYNVSFEDALNSAKDNVSHDKNRRIKRMADNILSKEEVLYPIMRFPDGLMLSGAGGGNNMIEDVDRENKEENIISVTNKYHVNGASYIFDWETLRSVYARFNDSFYIIPSSVNELMCVKSSYATNNHRKSLYEAEDDLLDMLFKMNQKNNQKDILSYNMYQYSVDDGEHLISIKQRF